MKDFSSYFNMASAIRALSMDAVQKANSGHPGMPMGMADVATVLFANFLKFNPSDPHWHNRDRFVLSAGHGSMLLYSLLHLTGYKDFDIEELKKFRQLHSKTAGHPEYGHGDGIETTTGPLGQGLANAVGMAIAEKLHNKKYGILFNHKTYVIVGDGCLMEGISQEAITLAGNLKLNKLIVLFDDNSITIDGHTSIATKEDTIKRFEAAGWNVSRCDGHNYQSINSCLQYAQESDKPVLIACKTIIGFGSPNKQNSHDVHGSPLGDEEIRLTREKLGWISPPFVIPDTVLTEWRNAWKRNEGNYDAWKKSYSTFEHKSEFERMTKREFPADMEEKVLNYKKMLIDTKPIWASRKSSQEVLNFFTGFLPELLGGSADLTGSNLTKSKSQTSISAKDFGGSYIHYGVREHAMAAIMNGISLHKGYIPYGGTFLVFSDYCRNAIRLSSLMNQGVIYVMTHDSIGLGEDGPTHQPVEHLSSLRAIPNLYVMRPCDAVETLECWHIALQSTSAPSLLALSRQNLPTFRTDYTENKSLLGGYVLRKSSQPETISIIATGSEIEIAMKAREELEKKNIFASVVSMPCMELFKKQSKEYKDSVLPKKNRRVVVEAGIQMSWDFLLRDDDLFFGMNGFGASAPASKLYEHFGITATNIVSSVGK